MGKDCTDRVRMYSPFYIFKDSYNFHTFFINLVLTLPEGSVILITEMISTPLRRVLITVKGQR